MNTEVEFEEEEERETLDIDHAEKFSEAVLFSSDWTVETILAQLRRENIQLNPNFQRREAWDNSRKSKFIETVLVGLPAPQLVLAEVKGQRGKYIVLDGKQRLLSLLRFTESEEDKTLGYALSGLEIRTDLTRKKFFNFNNDILLQSDLDAFLNYTIRTVIIRNWPNNEFLHQVFLRLNTGSVKLSPQELRQAMAPGQFSTFADDFSAKSNVIQSLLGRKSPDPRMRDVELLVRHIAFANHLSDYKGRMKRFLDDVCATENESWEARSGEIEKSAKQFELGIQALQEIFAGNVARKPGSNSFNKAIFDALSFYASIPEIRSKLLTNIPAVQAAYETAFSRDDFKDAIESDTAGIPNTVARIRIWSDLIRPIVNIAIPSPKILDGKIVIEIK